MTRRQGSTPLWTISVFIGLSEVIAGIAATQAEGWIAGTFAIFATAYPVAVTAMFFVLLWKRNWVLYPPSEFSGDVSPEAMAVKTRVIEQMVDYAVGVAVDTSLAESSPPTAQAEREAITQKAVEAARTLVERSVVDVDLSELGDSFRGLHIHAYMSPETTVEDFLNQVWFEIRREFKAYSYTTDWVLRDAETGERLTEMGTQWARRHGLRWDTRLARDAGMVPGRRLVAERL